MLKFGAPCRIRSTGSGFVLSAIEGRTTFKTSVKFFIIPTWRFTYFYNIIKAKFPVGAPIFEKSDKIIRGLDTTTKKFKKFKGFNSKKSVNQISSFKFYINWISLLEEPPRMIRFICLNYRSRIDYFTSFNIISWFICLFIHWKKLIPYSLGLWVLIKSGR